MNIEELYHFEDKTEKPLDRLVSDGGFCGIFRTIACIGDSLSSGEFESMDENGTVGYHDDYEYSWGQYLAREAGCKVYNFSRGGMTAEEYCNGFAEEKGFWDEDKKCQAYIMALGVNDISRVFSGSIEMGSVADIDVENPTACKATVIGYYGRILATYKKLQPKARIFLVTPPPGGRHAEDEKKEHLRKQFSEEVRRVAEIFSFTYVIDLYRYGPVQTPEYRKYFYLAGHLNAAGYLFTAKLIMSYIDYIIRHNMEDFCQIGFVGTPYHNVDFKW